MAFTNTKGDGSGTSRWLHGNLSGELIDAWHPTLVADEGGDDSDKTLTVPSQTEYQLLSVWIELVTTSTVGNRQLVIEFQDSAGDVIGQIRAGAVQAASQTRNYLFAVGMNDLTSFRDTDFLVTPLPQLILPADYRIRIYDKAAVAAAADDMVVQMMVNARSVPS